MATQTLYTFKANLKDLVKLQIEIDKATAKLKTLKKTDKEFNAQQAKVKNLGQSFKKQSAAMAGATTSANKMNKAGGKLVNTFKSAAVAIGAAFAVRAITGSVKKIIESFTEFEAQMAAVKAVSGATESEFKTLTETALALGASTSFTAVEVGKLQEEFARLGFSVEEIDSATKSTLDLAAATGESLAKSAQIAGSTLRAFGLDATLTKNVVDVMAASFTTSALNLDKFTESMKFVAPVARAVGFTLEETTAILGNLANNGIAGSIAGNSLKNIFLRLGDANSKLSKKLGGTVQGMPQLVEALKDLSAEGFSATDAVQLLDKRSAPAFLALIKNIDGLEGSTEILNNAEGAVTRMAAIRLDTLQGDMTILKSATEGLSIALGGEFDTAMRNIVFSLTEFVQGLTKSDSALSAIRTAVQLVGVALTALTFRFAALGLVSVIKSIGMAASAFSTMIIQIRAATTAQAALNAVMRKNPFILVATVVGTLAGAYFLLGEEASEAQRKQERLNQALRDELTGVIELNAESKKRAEAIRELKDAIGGSLALMDLELATQKELIEIRDLAKQQSEDKTELEALKAKTTLLEEEKRISDKAAVAYIARKELELKGIGELNNQRKKNQKANIDRVIRTAKADINIRAQKIKDSKNDVRLLQEKLDSELSATEVYQRLRLDGEKTFREKKRKFYDDELNEFREMTNSEQKIFKEGAEAKLNELTWVTEYRDLVTQELDKTGDPLDQAKLKTKAFVDSVAEMGFDVTKSTGDIAKMNIELTVMERFVTLLDGALKTTGGSLKTLTIAGFSLNKTKDQFKQLTKLMDEYIENEYQSAIRQSESKRDIALKSNDEQIALMQANTDNITSFIDTGSREELAKLIKANKGKYAAIKTLTAEQYADATNSATGNKTEMLKILQAMRDEEGVKLTTAFSYQEELYINHNDNLEKIQNKRDLSFAEDIYTESNLESDALDKRELNFFRVMRKRQAASDLFAKARIDSIESDAQRQLTELQSFYGQDYANNLAYLKQKEELELQSANKINQINQDSQEEKDASALESLQKLQEYYGMAFEAFSTFFANKMAIEKQEIGDFYGSKSEDLDTSLERELEAVDGNEAAQEDVRERYAILQEVNEAKKQEALMKIKKKQFKIDKANDLIQAGISGAMAMIKTYGNVGFPAIIAAGPVMAGLIGLQLAAIASQKFVGAKGGIVPGEKFADGGMVVGPSHANGGVKFNVGGRVAELEGGEAVINKRSTAMFRSQLSEMNAMGGGVKFADGGVMPGTSSRIQLSALSNTSQQFNELARNIVSGINSKEVIVSEASITNTQSSVSVSELTANIF
tara:strand:+ start:9482 stop:13462 length:3981 start_codon:yes stop_codon:yes gene_type:complete